MRKFVKPMLLGAVLALAAPVAFARDVTFMARPNGETLPLFVLQAKAKEFLPQGVNIVFKTVKSKKDIVAAIKKGEIDFGAFHNAMGAKLYSNGLTNLKLTGVHLWGGPGILSKTSIKPGDWQAAKGATLLAVPGVMTPPHKVSMLAMKLNGVKPKQDLMMAGANPHQAYAQMSSDDNAPDFVIFAEPFLSRALIKMADEDWPTKYHLFADSVGSVTAFGMPFSGLWMVGEQEHDKEIVAGFNKAVDYMTDPANRDEVSQIIADGFANTLKKFPPKETFVNVLNRGVYKANFKNASAIEDALRMGWSMAGLNPSRDIIWRGNDFKVPDKAVLVSEMLPRHVGALVAHRKDLGISDKSFMAALKIRRDVHAVMIKHIKKVNELENSIFDAYLQSDWGKVDGLLELLAAERLAASRLQIECIKRTSEAYQPEDLKKLRQFHIDNRETIGLFGGL